MIVHISVVACLLSVVTVKAASPVITKFDKVLSIKENIKVNQPLSTITCIDPDGDLTKVTIKSMSPPSPCTNCFEILDCLPDECLQYRAGVGTLSYSAAQYYLLTIQCDDNDPKSPPVSEVVQMNVMPNAVPYFDPDVQYAKVTSVSGKEGPNTQLYNVDAIDDDSDSVTYSMTVVPSTSAQNYKIDPLTGEITSNIDLRSECRNDVTFQVSISDGRSTNGPLVISVPFSNPNVAPVGMNLGTTVMIPEDTAGTAYTMKFTDGNNDPLTYTYTANNPAGAAQFNLDGKSPFKIDTAAALDYENSALRNTDLVVTATDGYCFSPPYPLRLQVTDVNEKPTISPVESSYTICEGQGEFNPGLIVTDPDLSDSVKWSFSSKTSNNPGRFSINPTSGAIITLINYDVDGNKVTGQGPMPTTQTFYVVATDKGGLTANATVTITYKDCNDNYPLIVQPAYEFATTECTAGGTILGTIAATDGDISDPNKLIYFEGSGGGAQVGTGGEIIVTQPGVAGTVITFNVFAVDRGINPGPLRSPTPAVVSVRFTPCPTPPPPQSTPAPTAAPPATAAPTTPKPATTTAAKTFTRTDSDPNLPWIIIAGLLGAFMLGLLTYMLWRYGRLCMDACGRINCAKTCKGRPAKTKKFIERPVTPVRRKPMEREKPSRPPSAASSEPEQKEPQGPVFLYGFWKENYLEDNQKQPQKGLPAPGDMNYHYPHTYDPAPQPVHAASTSPAQAVAEAATEAPKKGCIIQ